MFNPESTRTVELSWHPPARRRPRRFRLLWAGALVLVLLGLATVVVVPLVRQLPQPTVELTLPTSMTIAGHVPALPWPKAGQAAVSVDGLRRARHLRRQDRAADRQRRQGDDRVRGADRPSAQGRREPGPSLTVSARQAAEITHREQARGESLIPVVAGAAFTEREALQAVLLPSANNMARIIAAWDAGSVAAFVDKMNATAVEFGMANTRYTDPAGYAPDTVGAAVDQTILARKAMALPAFAEIVAQKKATLPIAGTVTNYNTLVGRDSVVGIKTGSTDEAGGCLMFAAVVTVGGSRAAHHRGRRPRAARHRHPGPVERGVQGDPPAGPGRDHGPRRAHRGPGRPTGRDGTWTASTPARRSMPAKTSR